MQSLELCSNLSYRSSVMPFLDFLRFFLGCAPTEVLEEFLFSSLFSFFACEMSPCSYFLLGPTLLAALCSIPFRSLILSLFFCLPLGSSIFIAFTLIPLLIHIRPPLCYPPIYFLLYIPLRICPAWSYCACHLAFASISFSRSNFTLPPPTWFIYLRCPSICVGSMYVSSAVSLWLISYSAPIIHRISISCQCSWNFP